MLGLDDAMVKNLPADEETRDADLIPGSGNPLEKEVATDFSILAWEITWTEEPDGLQAMAHRIRHD